MVSFEVTLMNKRTFEGRKIVLEARDAEHAFKKARERQCSPMLWATLTAVPQGVYGTKFKHKGVRY